MPTFSHHLVTSLVKVKTLLHSEVDWSPSTRNMQKIVKNFTSYHTAIIVSIAGSLTWVTGQESFAVEVQSPSTLLPPLQPSIVVRLRGLQYWPNIKLHQPEENIAWTLLKYHYNTMFCGSVGFFWKISHYSPSQINISSLAIALTTSNY